MTSRPRAGLLAALFLLSCGALLFEIALTRILSVFLFYHYTFLVVSGAVLGLGLGGLLILRRDWTSSSRSDSLALVGVLGTAAALATVATIALFRQGLPIPHPLIYLLLALLPFVPVGMASALLFAHFTSHSGKLYAADLGGAATGALLAVPLLNLAGGMGSALVAAVLIGGAATVFAWSSGRRLTRWVATAGSLLTATLLVYQLSTAGFDISVQGIRLKAISRQVHETGKTGQSVYSEWDAFARTDVLQYPDAPDHMAIFLDGGSASALHRFPRTPEEKALFQAALGYLPFRTGPNRRVLAIGPGGGEDVVLALLSGSERITAVEINPGAVRAVRRFGAYSGHIYDRPEVRAVVDEGRSFLRRSDEQYDLIYLSKAVTQAAERTGFALAENYLYTVEAFEDYLAHLAADGRVAFVLHDQSDLTRAFTTALAALVNRGESPAEASRHLVLINDRALGPGEIWYPVLLLKKSPFTEAELNGLFVDAVAGGFEPLFVPGIQEEIPFSLFSQDNVSLAAFVPRVEGMNVIPTTDDRPFFYALKRGLPSSLLSVMVTSLALLVAAVRGPPKSRRSKAGRPPVAFALYFAALGVGFMVVEVAVIQRFSLFLGYPTLSLTVTLSTLLLAGGIGGWLSQRVPDGRLSTIVTGAALVVSLLLIGYIRFAPWLTARLLAAPLPARVAVTTALVTPLGLVLGIPFPAGLRWLQSRLVSEGGSRSVAWVWGINGLASVLGSAVAGAVAMLGGFSWSLLLGSLIYLGVFAGSALYARPVQASIPRPSAQPSQNCARSGI
jgi:predicted membrane-bound spermidine synthase